MKIETKNKLNTLLDDDMHTRKNGKRFIVIFF